MSYSIVDNVAGFNGTLQTLLLTDSKVADAVAVADTARYMNFPNLVRSPSKLPWLNSDIYRYNLDTRFSGGGIGYVMRRNAIGKNAYPSGSNWCSMVETRYFWSDSVGGLSNDKSAIKSTHEKLVFVELVGSGGGGGTGKWENSCGGGGGGGGGYCSCVIRLVPGAYFSITVYEGGKGADNGGTSGNSTILTYYLYGIKTHEIWARAGGGGENSGATKGGKGGEGGIICHGYTNYSFGGFVFPVGAEFNPSSYWEPGDVVVPSDRYPLILNGEDKYYIYITQHVVGGDGGRGGGLGGTGYNGGLPSMTSYKLRGIPKNNLTIMRAGSNGDSPSGGKDSDTFGGGGGGGVSFYGRNSNSQGNGSGGGGGAIGVGGGGGKKYGFFLKPNYIKGGNGGPGGYKVWY